MKRASCRVIAVQDTITCFAGYERGVLSCASLCQPVPEPSDIQRDLEILTGELHRLEVEYNMFFTGRLPRPPWETRRRVETIIKRWDRGYIETGVDRFRFSTLQARYSTFAELWDREMRAREEGRVGPLSRKPPPAAEVPPPAPAAELPAERAASKRTSFSFTDPLKEMDKLESLYEKVMDARRDAGGNAVPFHKFADLVRGQVKKLRDSGYASVTFQVTEEHGQVSLTARGSVKAGE